MLTASFLYITPNHELIMELASPTSITRSIASEGYIENWHIPDQNIYTIESNGFNYTMFNQATQKIEWTYFSASAIIEAAIGNLTKGGIVSIKDGIYIISTQIEIINNNIIIVGQSWETELLLANSTMSALFYAYNKNGLIIDNITLNGNKYDSDNSCNIGVQHGINFIECNNSRIIKTWIKNFKHTGINLFGGSNNEILYNIVENNGDMDSASGSGIDCDGSNNTVISKNLAISNYVNGIWVTGTSGVVMNVTVSENCLVGNGGSITEGHGIHIGTAMGKVENIIVKNNIVNGSKGYAGILITSTFYSKIENNTSQNNKGRGISLLNSEYLTIIGNKVTDNGDYGGIVLTDKSSFNFIANNTLMRNENYAICILNSNSMYNRIENNLISGIIYNEGTETIIMNNYLPV